MPHVQVSHLLLTDERFLEQQHRRRGKQGGETAGAGTKGWLFLREEGCAATTLLKGAKEHQQLLADTHHHPHTHLGHGLGVHDGPILAPLPQEALDAQLLARVTKAGSQAHLARGGAGTAGGGRGAHAVDVKGTREGLGAPTTGAFGPTEHHPTRMDTPSQRPAPPNPDTQSR